MKLFSDNTHSHLERVTRAQLHSSTTIDGYAVVQYDGYGMHNSLNAEIHLQFLIQQGITKKKSCPTAIFWDRLLIMWTNCLQKNGIFKNELFEQIHF